ncbi:22205_t:CDS:2 [Cetraspora pellucida]|uniref:22205_t:CDS:1 n=1 Tax=Cetraspora pellucida TaxID=1433469 RepID=A0A9N9H2A9_9GLOM|nr:22205_t:CDS:2 [Cetraspora pellucida]
MNIAHSTEMIEDLKRSDRPRILTQEKEERIIELINSGECETATEVHSTILTQEKEERIIELINSGECETATEIAKMRLRSFDF